MRDDWTPESEARLRETYPRMVPCPPPDVHARVEILGRRCIATDLTNEISPDNPTFKDKPELLDGLVKIIRGFGGK